MKRPDSKTGALQGPQDLRGKGATGVHRDATALRLSGSHRFENHRDPAGDLGDCVVGCRDQDQRRVAEAVELSWIETTQLLPKQAKCAASDIFCCLASTI